MQISGTAFASACRHGIRKAKCPALRTTWASCRVGRQRPTAATLSSVTPSPPRSDAPQLDRRSHIGKTAFGEERGERVGDHPGSNPRIMRNIPPRKTWIAHLFLPLG